MSQHHRRNDFWPADDLAAHVWHLVAALEDIADLVEASKQVHAATLKTALIKKALVELKSFDELVSEFQATLQKDADRHLQNPQRAALEAALATYHRAVQPSRELLADIRNTLGAHRRSLPDDRQRARFGKDFQAWGAWEQHQVDLERKCTLEEWLAMINAAIALRNIVVETSPGSWFSVNSEGLRLYLPLKMEPDKTGVDKRETPANTRLHPTTAGTDAERPQASRRR